MGRVFKNRSIDDHVIICAGNPLIQKGDDNSDPPRVVNAQIVAVQEAFETFDLEVKRLLFESKELHPFLSHLRALLSRCLTWPSDIKAGRLPKNYSDQVKAEMLSPLDRGQVNEFRGLVVSEVAKIKEHLKLAIQLDASHPVERLLTEEGIAEIMEKCEVTSNRQLRAALDKGLCSSLTLDAFRPEVGGIVSNRMGTSVLAPEDILVTLEPGIRGFMRKLAQEREWTYDDVNRSPGSGGRYIRPVYNILEGSDSERLIPACPAVDAGNWCEIIRSFGKGDNGRAIIVAFMQQDEDRVSSVVKDVGTVFFGDKCAPYSDGVRVIQHWVNSISGSSSMVDVEKAGNPKDVVDPFTSLEGGFEQVVISRTCSFEGDEEAEDADLLVAGRACLVVSN